MVSKKFKLILSELFGTAVLLFVITGSGIMGVNLSQGNDGVALLANSIATGAGLFVLISLLGNISGAHFNPAVTLLQLFNKKITFALSVYFIFFQILGALLGVFIANIIFGYDLFEFSNKDRSGSTLMVSEFFATLILLSVIQLSSKHNLNLIASYVALTVTAGYWFTSSTFFVNPAVTIARAFTDTFVGISPLNVFGFIFSQLLALLIFILVLKVMQKNQE